MKETILIMLLGVHFVGYIVACALLLNKKLLLNPDMYTLKGAERFWEGVGWFIVSIFFAQYWLPYILGTLLEKHEKKHGAKIDRALSI